MAGAFAALLVLQDDLGVAPHHHLPTAGIGHQVLVADLHRTVDGGFDRVLLRATLGSAADVEGPHRELGAWLADRLGGDHADRLADVDDRAARQVAPIAFAADAALR